MTELKKLEREEIIHIDALAQECGMFTSDIELNNGYGCKSTLNTEEPMCCHAHACPIAVELDEDDPEWNVCFSPGKWMKKHSVFQVG